MRPSRRLAGALALLAVMCALVPVALALATEGPGATAGAGSQRSEPALEGTAAPEARLTLEGAGPQTTAKRIRFDAPATFLAAALGLLLAAAFIGIRVSRTILLGAPALSGVSLRAPPRVLSF